MIVDRKRAGIRHREKIERRISRVSVLVSANESPPSFKVPPIVRWLVGNALTRWYRDFSKLILAVVSGERRKNIGWPLAGLRVAHRVYENATPERTRIRFNLDRYLDRRVPIKMRGPPVAWITRRRIKMVRNSLSDSAFGRRYIPITGSFFSTRVNFFIGFPDSAVGQ